MLKQVLLKARIDQTRAKLTPLEAVRDDIRTRRSALATREAELERAIGEVTDDTPTEDKQLLEQQVEECVQQVEELEREEEANAASIEQLQQQLNQQQQELQQLEEQIAYAASQTTTSEEQRSDSIHITVEEVNHMPHTQRTWCGMTHEQRTAFFAQDTVKTFLAQVRSLRGGQQRAVSNGEVLIPTVVLDIVRDRMTSASKLAKHVNLQRVPGKARQGILGVTPEAVWTEMCAKINELDMTMGVAEVDGYKVAGFIPVCNALLEDADDVNLGQAIIDTLIAAIGLALDKAILYGTGVKMPMGIVTRLAQTADPGTGGEMARPWENLSKTHIKSISTGTTGVDLYKQIMLASGAAKGKYSTGKKFWAMSDTTRMTIMAELISINAAGAMATGTEGDVMPIIGGAIETLEFIPDGVIIGGYGDVYLLAERQGTTIAKSEHVRFTDDQTVFRGVARYDGMPVIPEAFVAMHIAGGTVSASAVTFAEDKANVGA